MIKKIVLLIALTMSTAGAMVKKLHIDMVSTVLYLPYVMALDVQDPDTLKIAAAADALAHAIKASNLYKEAQSENDQTRATWSMVKAGAHAGLCVNSIHDIESREAFVPEDIKNHKVNQLMQISLEALLRGASYYSLIQASDVQTARLTTELADIVGILRATNLRNYPAKQPKQKRKHTEKQPKSPEPTVIITDMPSLPAEVQETVMPLLPPIAMDLTPTVPSPQLPKYVFSGVFKKNAG